MSTARPPHEYIHEHVDEGNPMSAVTQLRRTISTQLAEVSGAPRPVLPAVPRPAAAQAAVIQLRPSAEPVSFPQQALPETDEAAQQAVRQAGSTAGTDVETAHRIAGIARSVAQGALEVLGGSRPLQQMARWLDPENYERLQLRANLVRCISSAPTKRGGQVRASSHRHVVVRSARVCPVSPGIYEASVVAFDQKRVRAVALRIEQRRGVWRVTALEIG